MEREKRENYDKIVRNVLLLLLCVATGFVMRGGARLVSSSRIETGGEVKANPCVVIDAGHGSGNLRKETKGNRYLLLYRQLNIL